MYATQNEERVKKVLQKARAAGEGPLRTTDIARRASISLSTVQGTLARLREVGAVKPGETKLTILSWEADE